MQQRRDALWPAFAADQFSFAAAAATTAAAAAAATASANAGANAAGARSGVSVKSATIGLDETVFPLGSFTRPPTNAAASTLSASASSAVALAQQPSAAPALAFPNLSVNASFADFVYDYFLTRHGHRDGADLEFIDFFATSMSFLLSNTSRPWRYLKISPSVHSVPLHYSSFLFDDTSAFLSLIRSSVSLPFAFAVERFAAVSARVRIFRRFATGAYSMRALSFYAGLTALIRHHGLGPLSAVGDNDEGVCWVELESIVKVLRQVRELVRVHL